MITDVVVGKVFETSVVAGAFILLLLYLTKTQTTALSDIAKNMKHVSDTMIKMDLRLEQLDSRIKDLEKGSGKGD